MLRTGLAHRTPAGRERRQGGSGAAQVGVASLRDAGKPGPMRRPASSIAWCADASGWSLDRKLSAKLKAGPRTIRSRARPNSVLAATLNREADAEIARILRSQEGRWEPKRPALVPRERPGGISPGETTTTSFPQGAAAVIQGSLRTTQRAP